MGISIVRQGQFTKASNYIVTTGAGNFNLPREDVDALYGPGWPIAPVTRPQDSDFPRSIDYPVGINYTLQPRIGYGLMPAAALKSAWNNVTEVSNPVNLVIRILSGFTKQLVDKDEKKVSAGHPYEFLTTEPDPIHHIPFNVWMTRFKKSSKIYAAPAYYIHRGSNNEPDAMEYIDGSTFFLITNSSGYSPEPNEVDPEIQQYVQKVNEAISRGNNWTHIEKPAQVQAYLTKADAWAKQNKPLPTTTPAFVQVIKGVPFSFWDKHQVYFMPEAPAPTVDTPYGETYIERAWTWINTIALVTAFHLGYYRTGNVPEGLISLPKDMYPTMGKIAEWE